MCLHDACMLDVFVQPKAECGTRHTGYSNLGCWSLRQSWFYWVNARNCPRGEIVYPKWLSRSRPRLSASFVASDSHDMVSKFNKPIILTQRQLRTLWHQVGCRDLNVRFAKCNPGQAWRPQGSDRQNLTQLRGFSSRCGSAPMRAMSQQPAHALSDTESRPWMTAFIHGVAHVLASGTPHSARN